MGILYIVSTPIGNLGDMTYRAVETLRAVSRILAEDTRRTRVLLRHYGIATPVVSAHEHNEAARAAELVGWLEGGEDVAVVTDAGTPLVSDPGARLVRAVITAGHRVVPVPGASAVLAGLVGSGLEAEPFTFYGFTPRGGRARAARLREVAELRHTAVLYEAPGRLVRLLADLEAVCGGEREAVVARELTKMHESFVRGTLEQLRAYYEGEGVRGEVVVMVAGRGSVTAADAEAEARVLVAAGLAKGGRPSAVAREVAQRTGLARQRVYEMALSLGEQDAGEVD